MPEPVTPPGDTPALDDRVATLEQGQRTIGDRLEHLIGIVSGQPGDKGPDGEPVTGSSGTPGAIAQEIREQLERKERERAAAGDREKLDAEIAGLKARMAELAETPPVPQPRRVERLMGWT
jgi:hypothetical protein